jgi:ribosomal protein L32
VQLEIDKSILDDEDGSTDKRLQKEAEKEVQSAALVSLKKLHMLQLGRCPNCGQHIHRHLFSSVCEECGWHMFDVPRQGPVKVHLTHGAEVISGQRCHMLKTGEVLVINKDVITARVPRDSVSWIEYAWNDEEIEQRHKQLLDRMVLLCGWCNDKADPDKDGFHLVHTAFGQSQERYTFCSDKCYEAFRKMYPARVHRNCYERNCAECNLCLKRYEDDSEGVRLQAKDFLKVGGKKKQNP